jgi:hypothetical protein
VYVQLEFFIPFVIRHRCSLVCLVHHPWVVRAMGTGFIRLIGYLMQLSELVENKVETHQSVSQVGTGMAKGGTENPHESTRMGR